MFCRLDKFDGPIIWGDAGRIYDGSYIRDVNWAIYLGSVYSGGLYTGGILTGFYGN